MLRYVTSGPRAYLAERYLYWPKYGLYGLPKVATWESLDPASRKLIDMLVELGLHRPKRREWWLDQWVKALNDEAYEGTQYRVDIRIDCLHQARFGTPLAGPRRDLTAAAAGLVDLLITTERSRSH